MEAAGGEGVDLDWKCGELAKGLACYRRGDFFLAHEHWEIVWLRSDEPEKRFLQALIQMSSACHHRQRGNLKGAVSLMSKSLQRLSLCSPCLGGIAVAELCVEVREWLRRLQGEEPGNLWTCPVITVLE